MSAFAQDGAPPGDQIFRNTRLVCAHKICPFKSNGTMTYLLSFSALQSGELGWLEAAFKFSSS